VSGRKQTADTNPLFEHTVAADQKLATDGFKSGWTVTDSKR
jgi:hypothetical protein